MDERGELVDRQSEETTGISGSAVSARDLWEERVHDYKRHVADLRCHGYEGALIRKDKEALFRRGFAMATPLGISVLQDVRDWYLRGEGTVETNVPAEDGRDGLVGSWTLSWPRLCQDRDRFTGGPLMPVMLAVVFPADWTHPHIALLHASNREPAFAWPFQVISEDDVRRQEVVLRAIAEAELHDRIFRAQNNWAVLPGEFGTKR